MEQQTNGPSSGNTPITSNGDSTSFSAADSTDPGLDLESPCRLCGGDALCGGLGVIRYNVQVGDPRFGKLYRCPHYPVESDQERQMKLRKLSNLGAFVEKSFESFSTDSPMFTAVEQQSLRTALDIALKFAEKPEGWLLLEGSYGVGKTHLAAAIANAARGVLRLPEQIMFITVPDLIDYLKNTFGPDANVSFEQRFQQIKNVPLLVLDDLGTEASSAWAKEKLFQLIDYRYITRKSTVFTTSKTFESLDPRVCTRLLDKRLCTGFEIKARSYTERNR